MPRKMIAINNDDLEMVSKIESLGTWLEYRNGYDVWLFNGKAYKIYRNKED